VVLLGMPCRIPAIRQVYEMPPAYYDATDRTGHPVLVISVDAVVREAWIVTRTTKAHAKGPGRSRTQRSQTWTCAISAGGRWSAPCRCHMPRSARQTCAMQGNSMRRRGREWSGRWKEQGGERQG
jgi:hypothetical protein